MADDLEDDQWLYGESNDAPTKDAPSESQDEDKSFTEAQNEDLPENAFSSQTLESLDDGPPGVDHEDKDQQEQSQDGLDDGMEDGEVRQNGDSDKDEDDDDDSDDDVNVVIGDIKTTTPSYTQVNIKRGGLITSVDKSKQQMQQQQQSGKFSVEEFEQIGTINGIVASDYNLDSLEDKPWRKPGADITDYFNYGFNEDTWRAYCERQKRMRVNESGTGLIPMNPIGLPRAGVVPITNDNSKYSGNFLGSQRQVITPVKVDQPKMNTIQVMTADRREYSRKQPFPDMSVPPPGATYEPFQGEYAFNPEPEPFYGYEPTQDSQWGNEPPPNWQPTELKQLTGPPPMAPPSLQMGPPPMTPIRSPSRRDSPHKEGRERDRESRSRSEKPRDRDRERSHRRERSRSRPRRHKSRSRSPSHRSHRKKKSRRHEDSD